MSETADSEQAAPVAPVRFEGRAVRIAAGPAAGRHLLFGGSLHYFRLEPRRWARALAGLRELGFTFVDTPVPWNVHERGPGRFDWSGARDLGAFLDACAGEGLPVLLRIGPRVGGELAFQGLPERIVADPAMLQRTNEGAPSWTLEPPRGWPAPSYASAKFLGEVGSLYRAIGEVVGPRLAPDGAVALVQLDHELGGFLRAGPFCGDYHPSLVARFAEAHGGAEPPRAGGRPSSPEALRPLLDWMVFRERHVVETLAALSSLAEEAGITRSVPGAARGALRLHGFPALPPVVYDVAAAERVVDAAAIAFLDGAAAAERTAGRARYLAGSSRFPLAAPLAIGSFPWGPSRAGGDGVAQLVSALGHGAFGWSASCAVGRDRWIGAPLDEQGRPAGPDAEPLRRLHRALAAVGWADLDRPAAVGVMVPREYGRLDLATSHLGPAAPLAPWLGMGRAAAREESFGFAGPIAREHHEGAAAVCAALQHAGVPYVLVDSSVEGERLARLRGLVVLTYDFLDGEVAGRLRAYAAGGGKLLWGPRAPGLDAAMQHVGAALPGERFDAAALGDVAAMGARLTEFADGAGGERRGGGGEVEVHRRGDGSVGVIVVGARVGGKGGHGHGHGHAIVRVENRGAERVVDVFSGEEFGGEMLEIPGGAAARVLVPVGATAAAREGGR